MSELGLAGIVIIGGMLLQCYRDLKFVRRRFTPASRQKGVQTVRSGEDVRAYLARAMEGSLVGFSVSSVFISTLWYPSLWIMMALVVALRNISEVDSGVLPQDAVRPGYPIGVPLPKLGRQPINHF